MPLRLVAIDEAPNIPLDREMVIVGRHPQCDARLDSIRVSRRHCCMTQDRGEVVVRDLGSTNGIRINGQRVEKGRLRPGDELSIAHIRFRVEDDSLPNDRTLADSGAGRVGFRESVNGEGNGSHQEEPPALPGPQRLEEAVREILPPGLADKYRIEVIVKMEPEAAQGASDACPHDSSL